MMMRTKNRIKGIVAAVIAYGCAVCFIMSLVTASTDDPRVIGNIAAACIISAAVSATIDILRDSS